MPSDVWLDVLAHPLVYVLAVGANVGIWWLAYLDAQRS
jgi:hypothetical protein